jgi:hypothetical protein
MRKPGTENHRNRYAGLVSQWAVGLSITLYGGKRLDNYFNWHTPMLTWILPLIFILGMLTKIIVETNRTKK